MAMISHLTPGQSRLQPKSFVEEGVAEAYSEDYLFMSSIKYINSVSRPSIQQDKAIVYVCMYVYIHVNERCRRKEGRSKQGHTNYKAKQHSTPKAVTFPKEN